VPVFLFWIQVFTDTSKIGVDSHFGLSAQKVSTQNTPQGFQSLLLVLLGEVGRSLAEG